MNISKPTAQDIQPLVDAARGNARWMEQYLQKLAGILKKTPLRYRIYGPYWWLVKQAFLANDIISFGTDIDREWFQALDYGNNELNLAAASLYEDGRLDSGLNIFDNSHIVEQDDGEPFEYFADDSDMEAMAAGL